MLIFFRKKKKEAPVLRVKIKGYEQTTLASWYHRLPYQILRNGDASDQQEMLKGIHLYEHKNGDLSPPPVNADTWKL